MKILLKILFETINLLLLACLVLIIVHSFNRNDNLRIALGIIILMAFALSITHFIISIICKTKLSVESLYVFFFLLGIAIIVIAEISKMYFLQYVSFVGFIPSYFIGFYLEHEDSIKQKVEDKIKENENNNNDT